MGELLPSQASPLLPYPQKLPVSAFWNGPGRQEMLPLHQNIEILDGNIGTTNTVPFPGSSSHYLVISLIGYFLIHQHNLQGVSHHRVYSPNKIRVSPLVCGWVFLVVLVFFQTDTTFGYHSSHHRWQPHLLSDYASCYLFAVFLLSL